MGGKTILKKIPMNSSSGFKINSKTMVRLPMLFQRHCHIYLLNAPMNQSPLRPPSHFCPTLAFAKEVCIFTEFGIRMDIKP
jgi:hypothetical protein